MVFKNFTALFVTLGFGVASAAAGRVTLDFESLNQTEIYSGTGWNGVATTDLLDTFAGSGVTFSAGVSGVNVANIFLPNGGGTNAITNSARSGGADTLTPSFTISAVGSGWKEVSFSFLATGSVTFTAYDSGNNVLFSDALPSPSIPLTWSSYSLILGKTSGIASIEFAGAGADLFLDELGLVLVPLPGTAGLALAGLGLLGLRRARREVPDLRPQPPGYLS